jgi:hypothetical protein
MHINFFDEHFPIKFRAKVYLIVLSIASTLIIAFYVFVRVNRKN